MRDAVYQMADVGVPMLTKDYFQRMNEADLRKEVLLPLLRAMGFKDVYEYHGGPGEKGKDIVCWKPDEVGNRENLALVVKATQITGKAQITKGTAGEVQTQIRQCFGSAYTDPISGGEEPIHRVWVVSNKTIHKEAVEAITSAIASPVLMRCVRFVDGEKLWNLVETHAYLISTIAREIERFLNQHEARSLHTARTYRSGLNRFQEFLIDQGIDLDGSVQELTLSLARDFVTWLGQQRYHKGQDTPSHPLSLRTRQNYAMAVSGLYRQLIMDGLSTIAYEDYLAMQEAIVYATKYQDMPIEKKLPPAEVMEAIVEAVQMPPPILTQSDLQERARHRSRLVWLRDKALVLSLYSTGMRVSELVGLRRQDLDYTDRGAWVTGRGERTRFVRFSKPAWQALTAYLEERGDETVPGSLLSMPVICRHDRSAGDHRRLPLTALSVERIIDRLAKETGVFKRFHLTPRSFRHYFASRFLDHTGDLALTQDVMGHAYPGTTRIYAKTTKDQHIEAHDSLFNEEDRNDE
jgi:site-specific recombinase XerD